MEVDVNRVGLGPPDKCRAFIIHRMARLNYTDLRVWATRQLTIYDGSIFADQDDWSQAEGPNTLLIKLRALNFNPRTDYLVLSGDILRIATVTAFVSRYWPTFCMLRYDRSQNGYWPFHVDLHQHTTDLPF